MWHTSCQMTDWSTSSGASINRQEKLIRPPGEQDAQRVFMSPIRSAVHSTPASAVAASRREVISIHASRRINRSTAGRYSPSGTSTLSPTRFATFRPGCSISGSRRPCHGIYPARAATASAANRCSSSWRRIHGSNCSTARSASDCANRCGSTTVTPSRSTVTRTRRARVERRNRYGTDPGRTVRSRL